MLQSGAGVGSNIFSLLYHESGPFYDKARKICYHTCYLYDILQDLLTQSHDDLQGSSLYNTISCLGTICMYF